MKILITGCAGFIGSHLTKKLLEKKHLLFGFDNLNDYYNPKLKKLRLEKLIGKQKNFKFLKGDICNREFLKKLFKNNNFDQVIHLAAQAGVRYSLVNPYVYQKTNLEGTLNILEMIRNYSKAKLIFTSSSSVYGNSKKIPFSENDRCDQPISLYSATKRAGELMVKSYHHLYGIKTCCLRLFTVYGPWGRPDMAYFLFTKALLENKPLYVFQEDTQRDFTYIDDITDGITASIDKDFGFEIINLGNSKPVNLAHLISCLEKETGKKAKIKIEKLPPGDVKKTFADISLAKKFLGWEPKTSIEEGLRNFVSWYKKEGIKLTY